jgi:hypothetical protein
MKKWNSLFKQRFGSLFLLELVSAGYLADTFSHKKITDCISAHQFAF